MPQAASTTPDGAPGNVRIEPTADRRALDLFLPDQRGHAPALPIPAVREKSLPVRKRAPLAAVHLVNAKRCEAAASERHEIRPPAAALVAHERRGGARILVDEGGAR